MATKQVRVWIDVSEGPDRTTQSAVIGCNSCEGWREVYISQVDAIARLNTHCRKMHQAWPVIDRLSPEKYDRFRK